MQNDPGYAFGWLGLACARFQLHDSAGTRAAAERGLALRPGWPEMTRQLVAAFEGSGDIEGALAVCEGALRANPVQPVLRSSYLLLLNCLSKPNSFVFEAHRDFGRVHGRPELRISRPIRNAPSASASSRATCERMLSLFLRSPSYATCRPGRT